MSDRQLQFRVGLFAVVALAVTAVMIFQFGSLKDYWEPRYRIVIHFGAAPGVHPSTPVRRNGITIGSVSDVFFDEKHGGVLVVAEIKEEHRLSVDARPRLVRSLLGDSAIEFTPGSAREFLNQGARIYGETPEDPMEIVGRLEKQLDTTLQAFQETSRQWQQVGENLNSVLDHNGQNLTTVVERSVLAVEEFSQTMQVAQQTLLQASQLVADPQNQANMKKMLAEMPKLIAETKETIVTVRRAVEQAEANLQNVSLVTEPFAQRSASIVKRLDGTMGNLESLSRELNAFVQVAAREDGSLQKLVTDPTLYRNLNRSAASLAVLLNNLEPVLRDVRIFSDKIARHPELLGVGGYLNGSSGLKDPPGYENAAPPRTSGGPAWGRRRE